MRSVGSKRLLGCLAVAVLVVWASLGRGSTTATPPRSPIGPEQERPNIVMIMIDDLDVASMNTAIANDLMPNFVQHIQAGGTDFLESFATYPLCCPSRSTYLTGQYPHNHGVVRNGGAYGGFDNLDHTNTLATWLRDDGRGYRTGHVGKFLNGYSPGTLVPPGWDDWQATVDPSTYCMYGYTISNNGNPRTYGNTEKDYQTDVLARLAARFVVQSHATGRPFFLSIATLAPHLESSCNQGHIRAAPRHEGSVDLPLPMPPSFNEPNMGDKPQWMRSLHTQDAAGLQDIYNERLAALRAVDDLIGTVVAALETTGEYSRTAFIFTSDNGYLLGQHRWQGKVLLYEESIRVPLFMRLPGIEGPPAVTRFALNNDLAPTIAALAGEVPDRIVDGRSLLPLLQGNPPAWRKRFLVEVPPTNQSDPLHPYYAVRTGTIGQSVRLIYGEMLDDFGRITDREHYDLAIDPYEIQSLHNNTSDRRRLERRILKQHMEALKTCRNGTCQQREEASP